MDHSNLEAEVKQYPRSECGHGMCLDHGPNWENIGGVRREPDPGVFGRKTYWGARHCGKPMARYKEVQLRRCGKCGREEEEVRNKDLALCLCCGYHFSNARHEMM